MEPCAALLVAVLIVYNIVPDDKIIMNIEKISCVL